ncbi:MAG: regulatory protein RecX [Ruminococcaceae bacterium]|nr:regulatory protein RecX [Oscillospiraceae bacterium]
MELDRAKNIVAKLLSYKMYTCSEVHRKLLQKGISEETADIAVAEFCKAGILNDAEYAGAYIHDGVLVHMKGLYRIRQELLQKGIAPGIIEKAMRDTEADTEAQLREYVELRFLGKEFSDWRELEKAKAHLVRRGFGISEINRCFNELDIKVKKGDID